MTSTPQASEQPVKPLDPPMTPLAIGGIALWAIAGVVLWIAGAPSSWVWICVAGVIVGIPGWLTMRVHDRNRARRRATAA